MTMKNSNDAIGDRTRDLPACSAVPQPTAPPRAPLGLVCTFSKTRERKYYNGLGLTLPLLYWLTIRLQ
jgi:hypothetical protein